MPLRSPGGRWSFTPPFHPCPAQAQGGLFSVALSVAAGFRLPCLRVFRSALPCDVRTFLEELLRGRRHPAHE